MNKGCIYWDEGNRGMKNGKPDHRGRWVAEKMIDGRRVRVRSGNMQRCLDFLNDCEQIEQRKPTSNVKVVQTFNDTRFMKRLGQKFTMSQRKEKLLNIRKETEMVLAYWESRDFSEINIYIEKTLLPRLNLYCTKNIGIRKVQQTIVLEAIGILYTLLYADVPVFSFEHKIKAMLRYYKLHNDFGYYGAIPEPVHQQLQQIDTTNLEAKFVVKRFK